MKKILVCAAIAVLLVSLAKPVKVSRAEIETACDSLEYYINVGEHDTIYDENGRAWPIYKWDSKGEFWYDSLTHILEKDWVATDKHYFLIHSWNKIPQFRNALHDDFDGFCTSDLFVKEFTEKHYKFMYKDLLNFK